MRRILTVTTLVAVLSLSACSSDRPTAASAPASTPPATSATPSPTADFASETACKFIGEATKDKSPDPLLEPGRVDGITAAAAQSKIPDIKQAAEILDEKYKLAIAQSGTDDELSANVNLLTAAIRLDTVCISAGLDSD
jgi:hypothetical protein